MKIKIFGLVFGILFLIGLVSAQICTVQDSCAPENTILKISSSTNAHGELWNQDNYGYYLCCDFEGTHACDGTNKILGLSAITNAHAEVPSQNNYATDVCFGNLSCTNAIDSCPINFPIEILSLSSLTNAHLGIFSFYDTKICCGFSVSTPVCGNGILEEGEECDDGNLINHDGCSNECKNEEYNISLCGDGILFVGHEECDDGNNINGDGCSNLCIRDTSNDDDYSKKDKDKDDDLFYFYTGYLTKKTIDDKPETTIVALSGESEAGTVSFSKVLP